MSSLVNTYEQMISWLEEQFEENYELLRSDGGHMLTQDAKNRALEQILLYWEKLQEIAESVTETEVLLTLPEQLTPGGRKFTILGVVDIVEENDQTVLYDVKTHDADYVRNHQPLYGEQLNVYAHIWQNLRGQDLDRAAIVATGQTDSIKEAFASGDEHKRSQAIQEWEPVIPIPVNQDSIEATIMAFAETVDRIENREFQAPDSSRLEEKIVEGKPEIFASLVCGNCDGRFSCNAYHEYAGKHFKGKALQRFEPFFDEYGTDAEQEEWLNENTVQILEDY